MQLQDIQRLAYIARIDISDEEAEGLLKDLAATLEYIEQVNKALLPEDDEVVAENYNVVREDVVTTESGSYTEALLAQTVGQTQGYVKVSKIL